MRTARNHYRQSTQNVKSNFALCALFALSMLMRNEWAEFEREVLTVISVRQIASKHRKFK
jgi:hypothetical protein